MKNLLFAIFILTSTVLSAQTYYCIQVCSTQNPELLKPEMLYVLPDTAMVEVFTHGGQKWYRILFCYTTQEEQWVSHTSWLKQWHDAMLVTRTKEQVDKMYPLFTTSN